MAGLDHPLKQLLEGGIFDFHHNQSGGQANFEIDTIDGHAGLQLRFSGGACCDQENYRKDIADPYGATSGVTLNQWFDFVFHVKWTASNTAGFMDVWLNDAHVASYNPQTANFAPTPGFIRALSRPSEFTVLPDGTRVTCAADQNGAFGPGCMQSPMLTQQPADYTLFNYWTASVGVAWVPWDWGRTIYNWRSAKSNLAAQKLTLSSSENQVADRNSMQIRYGAARSLHSSR